ncbi:aspartate-semialdehyde dehydrogenase [Solimonas aquatica]|uniref:Aspartate-semialdehyde dehydrogenase n=1 Tax=Solimonas aquatica TaxID=489703 RepID=A0A1H8ZZW0_9GAMM|nr:Asd/ArgC dimerization domain-containing protein [Solimonas aquatica]SEP69791.1 aspartate-semialdehyde dehydrogenase [Solimonas aquatica]
MSKRVDVALIGASGPLAEAVLELLGERRFAMNELSALALDPEEDATIDFLGRPLLVEDARQFEFSQVQLAFLCDGDAQLAAAAERAADAGVVVIDASGQDWQDSAIPRVLATLNPQALAQFNERGIIAAPDRLNIALAPVLAALDQAFGLRELDLTALLPASDFGRAALEDLARETTALLNVRAYERRHYAQQIAFNLIPQDADAGGDGRTERERRIADELGTLLGNPALASNISLVAAPVFYGFSASISARFAGAPTLEAARTALAGFVLEDSLLAGELPSPVRDAALEPAIRIARLRLGADGRSLQFWLSSDNLRGAADNAVRCGETLLRDYL